MTSRDSALARGRIAGLDGARGAACLCVVIAHASALLAPRTSGSTYLYLTAQMVALFFVLSGFLIFLPFCRRLAGSGRFPDLGRYWSQRVRRIFPAYVLVFVLADLAALVFVSNAVESLVPRTDAGTGRIDDPGRVLAQLTLISNLLPDQLQTGLNPSWSLTTELAFYLVLPVAGLGLRALVRRHGWTVWAAVAPGLVFVLVGLLAKVLLEIDQRTRGLDYATAQFGSDVGAVLSRSLLGQADTFGWGMVVCGLFVTMERGGLAGWKAPLVARVGGGLVVVALLGTGWSVHHASRFDGSFFSLAVAGFVLIVVEPVARGRRPRLGHLADTWPLKQVGDISLSVYLWHYPLLIAVIRLGWFGADSVVGLLLSVAEVLALSLAAGWLTHRLVEKRFMRR